MMVENTFNKCGFYITIRVYTMEYAGTASKAKNS